MSLVHLDGVEHGCCGPRARADAAEVARIGGFPFEICDMTREFDETVIDDFVQEHASGRTPNPCARCNGEIKFGAFLRRADELGIDFVATGHYVRSTLDEGGAWHLLRGADDEKDQSYMLHMLGQRELSRSLFPVGGMPKPRTRAHAERFGLPVAGKPDSQELCFAPSGDAGGFVRTQVPQLVRDGEIVDEQGRGAGPSRRSFRFHGRAAAGTRRCAGESRLRARRRCFVQPSRGRARRDALPPRSRGRPRVVDRGRPSERRPVRGRRADPLSRRGCSRRRRAERGRFPRSSSARLSARWRRGRARSSTATPRFSEGVGSSRRSASRAGTAAVASDSRAIIAA